MFPAHVETDRLHLRRFDEHVNLWEAYDFFGGQKDGILRNWVADSDEVRDVHVYTVTRQQYETNRPADLGVVIHEEGERP